MASPADRHDVRTVRRARRVLAAALGQPHDLPPDLVAAAVLVLQTADQEAGGDG